MEQWEIRTEYLPVEQIQGRRDEGIIAQHSLRPNVQALVATCHARLNVHGRDGWEPFAVVSLEAGTPPDARGSRGTQALLVFYRRRVVAQAAQPGVALVGASPAVPPADAGGAVATGFERLRCAFLEWWRDQPWAAPSPGAGGSK